MNRILGAITTLGQHFDEIAKGGEIYRPLNCPHCQAGGLWRHGFYHRKADHCAACDAPRKLVPVARFLCKSCCVTCSRLPACVAPRRWYGWGIQQIVLLLMLAEISVSQCSRSTHRARSSVRRWRDWLHERSDGFALALRSRFAELGKLSDFAAFWRHVMNELSLAQAMAWLDKGLIVP